MKKALIGALLLFTVQSLYGFQAEPTVSIIPKPVSVEYGDGLFELDRLTTIHLSEDTEEMHFLGEYLADLLYSATWMDHSISFEETRTDTNTAVFLVIDEDNEIKHPEGYMLSVTEDEVRISARETAGLFYGIQTLRQLFDPVIEHKLPSLAPNNQEWALPVVTIKDYPRFQYRGMHLDVARHFFPTDFVKKYIDLLAMHKMNRFHWHLTEDQGWRIEIKKYPKLTEIGAWRDSTLIGRYGTGIYDNVRYGGFYTQEEIREVVAYAEKRNITIIPEIEMPGHSSAALAAYPQFGCFEKEYHVQPTWGIFEDIYCPKEETFEFLEDVLTEVMELFPSTYIHIGGDEAPKKQWEESPIAQEVIKREGLKDEHELQSYFISRIEKFLNEHGRQIIGWDEILEGGLAPRATVMSWRGEKGGIEAAKMSHDVIMTPWGSNYYDHYQAEPKTEPLAIGGFTTLKDVYFYEPIPEELSAEEAKYVLGAQGNVWTEYMHSGDKVEYMAYPRAAALSEVLWTPVENKNWLEFWSRLQTHFERLDILEVNYAPHYKR
ncbi:MAG: beta-N-acetylhexosaminidase [Gracilimonas sp.]|uniref:beta-N-acetylhexosaminidase n=1 Tax=Gracilimonas TaxID=649462 RepID=UPI001B2AD95B|nr:beta-N-acetylhexosaminidase [Gracilimonas sp.]MBO6585944.1 beta-N-acetylhexosaminidase [Gracilimonas sp.]MBO6616941.1 beta-N-acetylhexosaminidase [Gracilimonas sp.]